MLHGIHGGILFFSSVFNDVCCRARYYELYPMDFHWKEKVDLIYTYTLFS